MGKRKSRLPWRPGAEKGSSLAFLCHSNSDLHDRSTNGDHQFRTHSLSPLFVSDSNPEWGFTSTGGQENQRANHATAHPHGAQTGHKASLSPLFAQISGRKAAASAAENLDQKLPEQFSARITRIEHGSSPRFFQDFKGTYRERFRCLPRQWQQQSSRPPCQWRKSVQGSSVVTSFRSDFGKESGHLSRGESRSGAPRAVLRWDHGDRTWIFTSILSGFQGYVQGAIQLYSLAIATQISTIALPTA